MDKKKLHRRAKIPRRFVPFLFPFLLSGFMTFLITGISMIRVLGVNALVTAPGNFMQTWLKAYVSAWLIAYPILLFVIPIVRRVVDWLTADE